MKLRMHGFSDDEKQPLLSVMSSIANKDSSFIFSSDDKFVYLEGDDKDLLMKRAMWLNRKINSNIRYGFV